MTMIRNRLELSNEEIDKCDQMIQNEIMKEPNDELCMIYEKRVLLDLSGMRIEKYDSPEYQDEVRRQNGKIVRNVNNPHYDQMIDYYNQIKKCQSADQLDYIISGLNDFLSELGLLEKADLSKVGLYDKLIDVRCCQNMEMYHNYLITKWRDDLTKKEISKFDKLMNGLIELDNLNESLNYIKNLKNREIFKETMDQLSSQVGIEVHIEDDELVGLDKCETLSQFMDYIYSEYISSKVGV